MAEPEGWPTLADVHRAVNRVDARLAGLVEGLAAQRRELDQHRTDDRRELDDHEQRLRSLSRWRWTLAGGLTVVGLVVTGVLVPLVAAWLERWA